MTELHLPLLEAAVLVPLLGAVVVSLLGDLERAHRCSIGFSVLALLCAIGAWKDFNLLHAGRLHPSVAHDQWDLLSGLLGGRQILVVDDLTAPKLPMIALLYFLTILTTQRTKLARFSFPLTLAGEAIMLATFACREPWLVVALLALGTVPTWFELRGRRRPTRVYSIYMTLFVTLMIVGWGIVELYGEQHAGSVWVVLPLLTAVLIRSGSVPLHSWVSDLFEHGAFGNALLFVVPNLGAYAAIRLLVPHAPDWVLHSLAVLGIITALYAAGMSLVQRDARRYFGWLVLSHVALVLVGLQLVTTIGLTGAFCVWLSAGIALGGLGLTLRAVEARFGRLSLDRYHGLYEHAPALAICFAITGLASVGFPGTIGFIGIEMLLDSAVTTFPAMGIALILAMALNGVSIIRAYFILFTGTRLMPSVPLYVGQRERFAVVVIALLLIGGGLYPQPQVTSRHAAAERILRDRMTRSDVSDRLIPVDMRSTVAVPRDRGE